MVLAEETLTRQKAAISYPYGLTVLDEPGMWPEFELPKTGTNGMVVDLLEVWQDDAGIERLVTSWRSVVVSIEGSHARAYLDTNGLTCMASMTILDAEGISLRADALTIKGVLHEPTLPIEVEQSLGRWVIFPRITDVRRGRDHAVG